MKTDVVVSATPSASVKPLRHIAETGCRGEFQAKEDRQQFRMKTTTFTFYLCPIKRFIVL